MLLYVCREYINFAAGILSMGKYGPYHIAVAPYEMHESLFTLRLTNLGIDNVFRQRTNIPSHLH